MDEYTNKLYEDFKTKDVLDGITADNFDLLRNNAFIVPENKEFFQDMLRVGRLSNQMSSSGPIPGTAKIETVLRSTNGTSTVFRPSIGEVWQLTSADVTATGGAVRFKFQLYDDSTAIEIKDQSVTSATDPVDLTTVPLILDRNVYLRINMSAISGSITGTVNCSFIRVR